MRLLLVIFLAVAQAINPTEEAEENRQKGIKYKNAGQTDSALYYLGIAQNQFSSLKDSLGVANVLVNIASVENTKGNYVGSYKLYQDALSYYQSLNDVQGNIKVHVNLGNQQLRLNNLNEAFTSYLRAEEYSIDSDTQKYLAYIYNGLGSILVNIDFDKRNIEDAEKYFNLALEIFKKSNSIKQAVFIYNNLAIIQREKGEFRQAIDSYQKYLELGLEETNQSNLLKVYHNLSNLYQEIGEYNLSLEYLEKAEEIAISISDPVNYIHILSNLVDVNMSLGHLEQAQFYLEKYKTLRDSVYDDEKLESLNELQVKYQTKEKEELLIKEIELSNERKWRNAFLSALLVVLVFAFAIIFWLIRKRRIQELAGIQQEREFESLKASLAGQEQERQRLAGDLHDSVGGVLTAVRMIHSSYKNAVGEKGHKVDELLQEAANTVREVSHNLSSNTLERYGLKKSIEQAFSSLKDSIEVHHFIHIEGLQLPHEVDKSIDYIVKELVNNTAKHAQANVVEFQLNHLDDTLIMTYEDDGIGMDVDDEYEGLGMVSIKNRVALIGGTFQVSSSPGEGFTCSLELVLAS